jgi:proteasome lid subunit RPN8/RPN11
MAKMIRPMPIAVQDRIVRSAVGAAPREICGFVLVTWGLVFMRNVAREEGRFAMDDESLLDFYREYGRQCIGMFHSHPDGRTSPSGIDAEYAPKGMRYWIATLTSVYEWDMEHDPPREVVNGRTRPASVLVAPNAEGGAPNGR